MTLEQFLALPPDGLPELVHAWGNYLGMCRRAADSVFLYHYSSPGQGFFVELYQDRATGNVLQVRAFISDLPLKSDIAQWVPTELAGGSK